MRSLYKNTVSEIENNLSEEEEDDDEENVSSFI